MTWGLISVELVVCGWIVLLLTADLLLPAAKRASLWMIALAGIFCSGGILAWQSTQLTGHAQQAFSGMWLIDPFASYFKWLFLITVGVVIVMTRGVQHHLSTRMGAFYLLLFTALLGMCTLASMNDFLMLFLGLELLTFSLYVMAAYLKTDVQSVEAGMKYLILGSVSSGFLIYGIALLYGFAGSTSFSTVKEALFSSASAGTVPLNAQAGMLLVLAALAFKVAAVPFHLWVPDVYQGAPTPVVALLSVGSKMAGIMVLLRLLYGVFLPLNEMWLEILAILSAATILYGNLGAIPQTNIKRLLGYSSIGHAGYLLMGLSTGSFEGVEAVGYYLLAYLVSNLTVFLVVVTVEEVAGGQALESYQGLSRRSPFLAAAMFVGLLSLAGVPPLAGFAGKLFVLLATVQSDRLWLVAIGAVNVAISLYYYLMVVKRMYLGTPQSAEPIAMHPATKITLALLLLGILVIGTVQNPFLQRISADVQP